MFFCHVCTIIPIHWTFISDVLFFNFRIQNWSSYCLHYFAAIYHLFIHYAIFLMLFSIFIIGSSKCLSDNSASVWNVDLFLLANFFFLNYGLSFHVCFHVYCFDCTMNIIFIYCRISVFCFGFLNNMALKKQVDKLLADNWTSGYLASNVVSEAMFNFTLCLGGILRHRICSLLMNYVFSWVSIGNLMNCSCNFVGSKL